MSAFNEAAVTILRGIRSAACSGSLLSLPLLLRGEGVGIDMLLHVAQMPVHAIEGAFAVAGGDRFVDFLVRGRMHRLALKAMGVLAEAAPGGVAPAGAQGVEQRQE